MSLFGPIIGADQLEAAVQETLQAWMTTYLAEMERQRGLDPQSLPQLRGYTNVNQFEKWPEDQLPVAVIISPGLGGHEPLMEGDGTYRALFVLGVAIICSANSQENTNKLSKLYGSAVRACLLQQQSLGGFAQGIVWTDERFDDIPTEDRRSLSAAQEIFLVEVADIVNSRDGLTQPPVDPYGIDTDWPEADTVTVTVEQEAQ